MTLLNKLFLQKTALIGTVLLLSACGGNSSSREAAATPGATEELQKLALADNVVAQKLVVVPTGFNSNQLISQSLGVLDAGLPPIADVYIGTLDVPYYFDPTNSTVSSWGASLAVRDTLTVPVMMTMPNVDSGQIMPDAGWPIVMYQHGITRNRTDVLAFSVAQASVGRVVIAIDLPTHGLTDEENPFHAANTAFATDTEQTFGVDKRTQPITDPATAFEPDGKVDTSGTHFINLTSLLTSRDNVRQGAANLLTLRKSLGSMINAATGTPVPIDISKVGLIAHSLGGVVAVVYLGVEPTETPSSIIMAGAPITTILRESVSFLPTITAGLARLGITSEADIDTFYVDAQKTIDAGEPANYAAAAAAKHPIHLIEVIGDLTVPNSTTENLATLMGAMTVTAIVPGPAEEVARDKPGIVRFIVGSHSSPLVADAATMEIQSQLAAFQANEGKAIRISNTSVIQQKEE